MENFMPTYGRGYAEDFFRNAVRSAPEETARPHPQPLAIAFVEEQQWRDIYTGDCALARGTLFAELYFPLGTLQRGGGRFE